MSILLVVSLLFPLRLAAADLFQNPRDMATVASSGTGLAVVEDVAVKPSGDYAQIDTRLANKAIQVLAKGSVEERQRTIEQIKVAPDKYAPPVFYLLSEVLFQDGKRDEGAFWFYAGQLRANFDASRCADASAREAVSALDLEYAALINRYTFQDLPKLEQLVAQVIEWDRKTPHNYDHRWINLHGMAATMAGLDVDGAGAKPAVLSLPKEQWDEIAEKTRADYLAAFRAVRVALASDSIPASTSGSSPGSDSTAAGGGVVIQVFSSEDKQQADQLRERLAGSGLTAFLSPISKNGHTLYRVRIGPFPSRSAAEPVAQRVGKDFSLYPWITSND